MIKLPSRLANLLHGVSDEISAAVGSVVSTVLPILRRNEAPFFSDYTDHGIVHVENVLNTCEHLISDDGWSVFTREDAAVLIIATLGHDLGMLLNTDGFAYQVSEQCSNFSVSQTDHPWHKQWLDFQLDARRFDGATLIEITGSPEPVGITELDCQNFTDRGRKIAGEFLRRNHHRIAYEIIVGGMPTQNGRIGVFDGAPKHMREMAGLVAWSHGVKIRETLDVLIERGRTSHREYRHVHPTFLMCLVRLADYLDLDTGRAPATILSLKSLKSPISKREWWAHNALVDCHSHAEDPESLHIVVEPSALPDVATFSVIEEKVSSIQSEIDSSWAVLGEVYGRFPPLNRLALRIRRVMSDIRADSITSQLPFVPHKAALESARSDLLKLLIGPLYGDDPGIGIRELLQNSIDAVREISFLQSKMPMQKLDTQELQGDVVVTFKEDEAGHWVCISDRGIGMTWMSVCKYYLTAGASFRQSDAWKKRFTDDTGLSQVLRSGRFGIGVLAAFLIGDRVHVSTRHAEQPEDRGIEFEFGLDDTIIEMKWKKRKVGTTIKVRTTEVVVKALFNPWWRPEEWDWYCLDEPNVVRFDLQNNVLKQQHHLPSLGSKLPLHWHMVEVGGLQAVHWTYRSKYPSLVCNGIIIRNAYLSTLQELSPYEHYERSSHLVLSPPHVSVFDPDGKLPLNLSRNNLASYYKELFSRIAYDQCLNFLAFLLVHGPKSSLLAEGQFMSYCRPDYPIVAVDYNYASFGYLFAADYGFGITDPWNIAHFISSPALIIRLHVSKKHAKIPPSLKASLLNKYGILLSDASDGTLRDFDLWHRMLALTPTSYQESLLPFRGIKVRGVRTIMPTSEHERFLLKQRKYVVKSTLIEKKRDNFVVFSVGMGLEGTTFLEEIFEELISKGFKVQSITECFFDQSHTIPEPGPMAKVWKEVIGRPLIPFNDEDRETIIKGAGPALQPHLQEWSKGK